MSREPADVLIVGAGASGGVVALRLAEHVSRRPFDRLYNNFDGVVPTDALGVVRRSAERHAAWARGDFDDLT